MTKGVQNEFIHFMQMLTSKQSLHFSRSAFTNENIHKQNTTPSWSVILMLLMTINKFSESGRICVNQGLDLVLESHAILCKMPFYSSVVFTSSINIVSFRIWRFSWSHGNDRNPIVLDQYGEQISIGHRKCVVHFGPFSFLTLIIT